MTNVSRIARKEILDMWRDGRIRWTAAIVFALLAAALASGLGVYEKESRLRRDAQHATRHDWLAQTPKNPHSAAHYGVYAFKPSPLLSFADRGVDDYAGVVTYLEAHKQNDFKYRPAQDETALARFGNWTAASVMQLLVPLLIVLLAFPSFVGERETATLRQVLGAGVAPRELLRGKALGVVWSLAALLVPIAFVGATAIVITSANDDVIARAGLLALVYVAYYAIVLGVSLMVSARAPSSRVALLVLLGFWAVNSLVAPRALADVSRAARPTQSSLDFNRFLESELAKENEGANEALAAKLTKEFGVASTEQLPFDVRGISLQAGETRGNAVFDAGYGALHDAFVDQTRMQRLGAVAAPLTAVRFLSMGLSGTDYEAHWEFGQSAERYRRALVAKMNMAVAFGERRGGRPVEGDSALWATMAPFRYEAEPVGLVLERERVSLSVLLVWVAVVAIAASTAVGRLAVDPGVGTA